MRQSYVYQLIRDSSGQSETLGYVLLVAVTIAGIVGIAMFGSVALSEVKQEAEINRAETSFTALSADASQVALGTSSIKTVDIPEANVNSRTVVNDSAGWVRIRILNVSNGSVRWELNKTLGALVHQNGDTEIAYQGGGVWRLTGNTSVMVSSPQYHYREGTVTFPIITVNGEGSVSDQLTIKPGGKTNVTFPAPGDPPHPKPGFTERNPVKNVKVKVTVHSDYYQGWAEYFRDRTQSGVTVSHANETVTATLLDAQPSRVVQGALMAWGGSGDLVIQGGGGNAPDICSYNSSTYSANAGPTNPPSACGGAAGSSGDVITSKDIKFKGGPELQGNLTTSGKIIQWGGNGIRVRGYVSHGEGNIKNKDCNDHVEAECAKNASLDTRGSIDAEVNSTISDIKADNDNAGEPCFSQSSGVKFGAGGCGSTVTLTAGDYYVNSKLVVGNGEKLILDTTGGEIRIAVDGNKKVEVTKGNITVVGNGTARIYNSEKIQIQQTGTIVWNRGWDSHQLWFYCSSDCEVLINKGDPTFNGVVYAPGQQGGPGGKVTIKNKADIFGAVVGSGDVLVKNQADAVFDTDLKSRQVFDTAVLPGIAYLHLTVNELNMTDA